MNWNRLKEAKVTMVITALCVLVFAAIHLAPLNLSKIEKAIFLGAYYKPFVLAGEWWRLVSVGLVHVSVWHLMMNLFSFSNTGPLLEREYGRLRYALILCGSIAGGSLFQLIRGGNTIVVGLSGGLYGLMAAYIMLVVQAGGMRIPAYRNMSMEMLMVNLMINFMPNIAYLAHIGGFVTGALLGIILKPGRGSSLKTNCSLALVILLGAMIWLGRDSFAIGQNERYIGSDLSLLKETSRLGLSTHSAHMAEKLDQLYGTEGYIEAVVKEGS